jgi:hypothetical protein
MFPEGTHDAPHIGARIGDERLDVPWKGSEIKSEPGEDWGISCGSNETHLMTGEV